FRRNALRLWGMEGNLFKFLDRAHHMIPQAGKVVDLMTRLGVQDMVHNPLFSRLYTQAEHEIIHSGSGPGGWYNRMWLRFLDSLDRQGVHGNDAVKTIIDFMGNTALPKIEEALRLGGPPPGV